MYIHYNVQLFENMFTTQIRCLIIDVSKINRSKVEQCVYMRMRISVFT
jgi:hypothetical protein